MERSLVRVVLIDRCHVMVVRWLLVEMQEERFFMMVPMGVTENILTVGYQILRFIILFYLKRPCRNALMQHS